MTKTKTTGERDLATVLLERHRKRVVDVAMEREFYSKAILRKAAGEVLSEAEEEALEVTAGILGRDLKMDLGQACHVHKLTTKWLGGLEPDSSEVRINVADFYARAKEKVNEATELEAKAKALRGEAVTLGNRGNTIESASVEVLRLREALAFIYGGQS